VVDHLLPVALVPEEQPAVEEPAAGTEVAGHGDRVAFMGVPGQLGEDLLPALLGDQAQGVLVHGARDLALEQVAGVPVAALGEPREGVEGPLVGLAVVLQPLLEEPDDGGLGRPDRSVEQEHAALGAVAAGGGVEHVHQLHQGNVQAEDGVLAVVAGIVEEVVVGHVLLGVHVLLRAVRVDHVVEALEGRARRTRVLPDDLQVLVEVPFPVEVPELLRVLHVPDEVDDGLHCGHGCSCQAEGRILGPAPGSALVAGRGREREARPGRLLPASLRTSGMRRGRRTSRGAEAAAAGAAPRSLPPVKAAGGPLKFLARAPGEATTPPRAGRFAAVSVPCVTILSVLGRTRIHLPAGGEARRAEQ